MITKVLESTVLPLIKSVVKDTLGLQDDDPKAKEIEAQVISSLAQVDMKQLEVAVMDAQSKSPVQRLWRPTTAWMCVFGVFYSVFVQPIGNAVAKLYGHVDLFPTIPGEIFLPILIGMLGLTAARSFDKMNRTDTK